MFAHLRRANARIDWERCVRSSVATLVACSHMAAGCASLSHVLLLLLGVRALHAGDGLAIFDGFPACLVAAAGVVMSLSGLVHELGLTGARRVRMWLAATGQVLAGGVFGCVLEGAGDTGHSWSTLLLLVDVIAMCVIASSFEEGPSAQRCVDAGELPA